MVVRSKTPLRWDCIDPADEIVRERDRERDERRSDPGWTVVLVNALSERRLDEADRRLLL